MKWRRRLFFHSRQHSLLPDSGKEEATRHLKVLVCVSLMNELMILISENFHHSYRPRYEVAERYWEWTQQQAQKVDDFEFWIQNEVAGKSSYSATLRVLSSCSQLAPLKIILSLHARKPLHILLRELWVKELKSLLIRRSCQHNYSTFSSIQPIQRLQFSSSPTVVMLLHWAIKSFTKCSKLHFLLLYELRSRPVEQEKNIVDCRGSVIHKWSLERTLREVEDDSSFVESF